MWINTRPGIRVTGVVAFAGVLAAGAGVAHAQARPLAADAAAFTVNGEVALHSLMALGDGHMQKLADVLAILAGTAAARSGDWERIRAQLTGAARVTVPAAHWFALPDGSYWTLEHGRATASLADRPYFARVLGGQTVVGELVVSRSSNRNSAVVAVPVRGRDNSIVGVLGSSVQLDSLAARIRQEMGGLDESTIFYAIDAEPLGALNSDPSLIFTDPMKLGDAAMRKAFTDMLTSEEGVVTYDFRGGHRTVIYRKSPITGWWYAFGVIRR